MLHYDPENLKKIMDAIGSYLQENNILAELTHRLKDPYSILKKMTRKNLAIQELTDIIAFRIIVPTQEDCYKALGVIDHRYKLNAEKLKDFINTPKKNGYQSLHIVISDSLLKRGTEIQIRTKQMHNVAEFGTANHKEYKKNQEKRISMMLMNTSKGDIFLLNAYRIYRKFDQANWTIFDLFCYEQEMKKIWAQCQTNLSETTKEFLNTIDSEEINFIKKN
jgi:(p)ppGpp synthase/HD superfamily hydrolase